MHYKRQKLYMVNPFYHIIYHESEEVLTLLWCSLTNMRGDDKIRSKEMKPETKGMEEKSTEIETLTDRQPEVLQ